jgi:hypothetical protein
MMISRVERAFEWLTREENMGARLFVMLLLALFTNMLGCSFAYATAHRMTHFIGIIGFFLPMINFSISMLFLGAQTLRERLYIMLINSVALSIGGVIVSLYFTG